MFQVGVWNRDRFSAGRLRDVCKACPNTAWLLFLLCALALIGLVSLSVYLSKKRLNLAILGIGVVRACLSYPPGARSRFHYQYWHVHTATFLIRVRLPS